MYHLGPNLSHARSTINFPERYALTRSRRHHIRALKDYPEIRKSTSDAVPVPVGKTRSYKTIPRRQSDSLQHVRSWHRHHRGDLGSLDLLPPSSPF